MIHKASAWFAALAALATLLPAQAGDDDKGFDAGQAKLLNAFAKRAFKAGFPRQAKLIWLQAIKLYDADNAEAHQALGHVKMGSSWAPRSDFSYPVNDTGSGNEGAALFRDYESLKKELAAKHRAQAQKAAKAGRRDKELRHWQMVLRWVKTDKEAQEALEHKPVGLVTGTSLEQTLYDRSKQIEAAVTEQSKIDYDVKPAPEVKHTVLDKAQVPYVTFTSEHFTLHGDPGQEEALQEALVWAERTLRVVQVAFPAEAFPRDLTQWRQKWAFFVAKDTYKQILTANRDKISDLEWRIEHTSTAGIGDLIFGATQSSKVLFDACVRNVARAYAGFGTDGLNEGIGHTFVGMMFNNNRLFSVDLLKQQGTVASEEDRQYQSPDFDVWKDLNLELAWKSTGGVPARDLPFCDAAKFSNEQRIKAWSFSDYMMRRDPALLLAMDRLALSLRRGGTRTTPDAFAQKFTEQHQVSVEELDKGWEDFWTGASPVLQAIRNDTPPLASVSKGVEKWLEAYNEARKELDKIPVPWSANLSTRCRDHAIYLKDNKDLRGPLNEHTQDPLKGGSHLGAMFAEMAVVETDAKIGNAKKMFRGWLDIPGYRDALLNNYIGAVGIYVEGSILVMNTVSALGEPKAKSAQGFHCYPREAMRGIPAEVKVADIGPELVELLKANGHEKLEVVGYPLTLHFGVGFGGNRNSVRCTVSTERGETIPSLVLLDNGRIRRSTAPGMLTCYPLQPLKGKVTAVWTWEQDNGAQRLAASFFVK